MSSAGGGGEHVLTAGAAGAGSLILEFAVLSRLTGDRRFEVGGHRVIRLTEDPGAEGVSRHLESTITARASRQYYRRFARTLAGPRPERSRRGHG